MEPSQRLPRRDDTLLTLLEGPPADNLQVIVPPSEGQRNMRGKLDRFIRPLLDIEQRQLALDQPKARQATGQPGV